MEEFLKKSLEKANETGAGLENIRICKIIADKIVKSDNVEVSLALMKLLNELQDGN